MTKRTNVKWFKRIHQLITSRHIHMMNMMYKKKFSIFAFKWELCFANSEKHLFLAHASSYTDTQTHIFGMEHDERNKWNEHTYQSSSISIAFRIPYSDFGLAVFYFTCAWGVIVGIIFFLHGDSWNWIPSDFHIHLNAIRSEPPHHTFHIYLVCHINFIIEA